MSHLSREERKKYTMRFLKYDKDGNGYLDVMELGEMFLSKGQDMLFTELKTRLNQLDENSDGRITLDEFLAVMPNGILEEETNPDHLKERFRTMDKDGDGFVTADDFYEDMTERGYEITMDDAIAYINKVDTDGDGKIDVNDYLAFNN